MPIFGVPQLRQIVPTFYDIAEKVSHLIVLYQANSTHGTC